MYKLLIIEDDQGITEAIKTQAEQWDLQVHMAGIHLAFAFPVISKILVAFSFTNTTLNAVVTLISFIILGVLYAIVYKLTSGAYYAIVSGRKD